MRDLKIRLHEKCIELQKITVKQLQDEIDEAIKQSNEYGQPKDRYDAYKNKLMRQVELFGEQLKKANLVLATLQRISVQKEINTVEFGALVITDSQKIFVSAGLGKINLNEEDYYAISPAVPIYKAIAGMKKGESTIFNGKEIIIQEIC